MRLAKFGLAGLLTMAACATGPGPQPAMEPVADFIEDGLVDAGFAVLERTPATDDLLSTWTVRMQVTGACNTSDCIKMALAENGTIDVSDPSLRIPHAPPEGRETCELRLPESAGADVHSLVVVCWPTD